MDPPRNPAFDPGSDASVFHRAALEGSERERASAADALGNFPGPATIEVLTTLFRDQALPDLVRGAAAFAARQLAAPELGPPLLDALGMTGDLETRKLIIQGLASSGHAAAAPAVLEALLSAADARYQAHFSVALAMFGYHPAEPAIRALAEGSFPRGTGPLTPEGEARIRAQARLSLLRLVGEWGAPREGLSLLLVGPDEALVGDAIRATLYVEHERGPSRIFGVATSGRFFVEGVGYTPHVEPYLNVSFTLDPSVLWKRELRCGEWPSAPGAYRLRYEAGAAVSNTVTVVVKAR